MTHTPHELIADFPDQAEAIHDLRQKNAHFDGLANRYHEVNRAVHRAETDVEPTSDSHLNDLKRQRMVLKDEIAGLLASVGA